RRGRGRDPGPRAARRGRDQAGVHGEAPARHGDRRFPSPLAHRAQPVELRHAVDRALLRPLRAQPPRPGRLRPRRLRLRRRRRRVVPVGRGLLRHDRRARVRRADRARRRPLPRPRQPRVAPDREGRDDHRLMEVEEYARSAAAEDGHWWYRNTRALMAELLQPWLGTDQCILDAGCGPGGNGAWLASHGQVTGVDLAREALEFVRARRPATTPVQASAARLPFADGVFDVAAGITLLYTVRDDVAAVG